MSDARKRFGELVAKNIRAAGGLKGKPAKQRQEIFAAAARKARAAMGGSSSDGNPRPKRRRLSRKARAAAIRNLRKARRSRSPRRRRTIRGRGEANLAIGTPGITRVPTRRGGQMRGDPHATPLVTTNSFIIGSEGELPLPGFVTGSRSAHVLPRG